MEKGKYDPSLELAFKIAGLFETKIEGIFKLWRWLKERLPGKEVKVICGECKEVLAFKEVPEGSIYYSDCITYCTKCTVKQKKKRR